MTFQCSCISLCFFQAKFTPVNSKVITGVIILLFSAVSRKVVQLKSIKAYATIPKDMMGCGCSLLHRQVHEFSARWKAVL